VLAGLTDRFGRNEWHLHMDHQIPITVRPDLRLDLDTCERAAISATAPRRCGSQVRIRQTWAIWASVVREATWPQADSTGRTRGAPLGRRGAFLDAGGVKSPAMRLPRPRRPRMLKSAKFEFSFWNEIRQIALASGFLQ
jgi:hypothetical protein